MESCLAGFLKGEHDMSASKQTAFDYIDEKSGVITDVSDKIWDYAELSLREYKSGELYAKVLKEEGIYCRTSL